MTARYLAEGGGNLVRAVAPHKILGEGRSSEVKVRSRLDLEHAARGRDVISSMVGSATRWQDRASANNRSACVPVRFKARSGRTPLASGPPYGHCGGQQFFAFFGMSA
jgi:hypothetical protein